MHPNVQVASIGDYIAIARPDHWTKNVFMLPGVALALVIDPMADPNWTLDLAAGFAATCLLASANYTINEFLDGEFDRFHPKKRDRPTAQGLIKGHLVLAQYVLLAATGLMIAYFLNPSFFSASIALLFMGIVYNVPPIRTKDLAYIDVLSESINNPIRLVLGWATASTLILPPVSILLSYWLGGAFLMAVKRFAEYRLIGDAHTASQYRRSFGYYTEDKLMISAFFYAISSALFMGVFLIKYKIEFLLAFPLFAILFAWYLHISLRPKSSALSPEKMYREPAFIAFVGVLCLVVVGLFFLNLPILESLVSHTANEDMRWSK
jgi:4-hydroxybenzoate polyprenyltransferase